MQLQLQLRLDMPKGVMSGFCFSYAFILLEKLKKLDEQDGVFEQGNEIAKTDEECYGYEVSYLAASIISQLLKQIDFRLGYLDHKFGSSCEIRYSTLRKIIDTTEEFLKIFIEE